MSVRPDLEAFARHVHKEAMALADSLDPNRSRRRHGAVEGTRQAVVRHLDALATTAKVLQSMLEVAKRDRVRL